MRVYSEIPSSRPWAACVLAVGNFDGLHLGHQSILRDTRAEAQRLGLPAALLTFEPHPRSYFRPGSDPFRLTSLADKIRFLEHENWDLVFALPFDQKMAQTSARDFVHSLLYHGFMARSVFAGADFHFGAARQGTPFLLQQLGAELGIGVTIIPQIKDETGAPYSSTFIRGALKAGDVASATRQLGRPWSISGTVFKGDQRGRQLGFPTANITLGDYLHPAYGVYAVRAEIKNRVIRGVANIGSRPSVGGIRVQMEAHLFDFSEDLYRQDISVNLIDFIRPERKFPDLPALQQQIQMDCDKARSILGMDKLHSGTR